MAFPPGITLYNKAKQAFLWTLWLERVEEVHISTIQLQTPNIEVCLYTHTHTHTAQTFYS